MFMNVTALHNKISNQQHLFERNTAQTKNLFISTLFRHVLHVKHVILMNCTCGHSARLHRIACETENLGPSQESALTMLLNH